LSYALLIPAAGKGERLGAPVSKALVSLNGKPLIWWALNAFIDDSRLKQIIVATSQENQADLKQSLTEHPLAKLIVTTLGGATRQDSVGRALDSVTASVDHVLVHDAARPFVTRTLIDAVLKALTESAAALPGVAVTDTIKRVDSKQIVTETLPRNELFAAQTPQGIRTELFRTAHRLAYEQHVQCTDDVALIEKFRLGTVKLVAGDSRNLKITHPHESPRAEELLRGFNLT